MKKITNRWKAIYNVQMHDGYRIILLYRVNIQSYIYDIIYL